MHIIFLQLRITFMNLFYNLLKITSSCNKQKQPQEMFYKNYKFLINFTKFTEKHLCQSLFFKACSFIKKETLTQVFSCEFCETSKNTFFTEHLWTTTSEYMKDWNVSIANYGQITRLYHIVRNKPVSLEFQSSYSSEHLTAATDILFCDICL